MRSVSDARDSFNSLIADATAGLTTHVVKGSTVVAHLVPATTWIVDDQLVLEFMLDAVIRREAAWAAADNTQGRDDGRFSLTHAGDVLGRVLGWAWRTDPDRIFMRAITSYAAILGSEAGRPMSFADVRLGLAPCLGGGALERSEVSAALDHAERHWDLWAPPRDGDDHLDPR